MIIEWETDLFDAQGNPTLTVELEVEVFTDWDGDEPFYEITNNMRILDIVILGDNLIHYLQNHNLRKEIIKALDSDARFAEEVFRRADIIWTGVNDADPEGTWIQSEW